MMNRIAIALSAVLLASFATVALAQSKAAKLVGKKVPSFTLTDINGKKWSDKSLKGKVVVLDFWASWCGPCKAASPSMDALQKKYGKQGLVIIGANTSDPKKYSADYKKQHSYTYTFAINAEPLKKKLVGDDAIPLFVFIDRQGVVRNVETGFKPKETPGKFETIVKGLVTKK